MLFLPGQQPGDCPRGVRTFTPPVPAASCQHHSPGRPAAQLAGAQRGCSMLSALRPPRCCCAGRVCQPPPTPAPLPPNSLFCGSQGPEVATPGQACHPATQFQAWWPREGLLLSADTLPEVYVESHRPPSVPQLPDSVPVLLWPGLAPPQTGDRAVSEAGYFPRAALAVHLPGPTAPGVGRMAGTMQQGLGDPSVRLLGKREPAPAIPAQCWGSRQLSVPRAALWVSPGGHLYRPLPTPSLSLHSKQGPSQPCREEPTSHSSAAHGPLLTNGPPLLNGAHASGSPRMAVNHCQPLLTIVNHC